MFIKEIVKLDTQGKFIPAVQLSDFDSPQDNLGLVKSYIFAPCKEPKNPLILFNSFCVEPILMFLIV